MNHVMSFSLKQDFCFKFSRKVGVYSDEVTPVPIPNTEVKLINVNDTWLVTTWESKTMPAHNSIGSCFFQLPIFLLLYNEIIGKELNIINAREPGWTHRWCTSCHANGTALGSYMCGTDKR